MILGNGDIASALQEVNRPDLFFFACGVSNSRESRAKEYAREQSLLIRQNRRLHVVYFSSLSVLYANNRYAKHKLHMEKLIKQTFSRYTIVRLGNITWGDNPNTIINFLTRKHELGEPLEIQDAYRYIIDKQEFQHWMSLIPKWNCEMNITGARMKVQDIVNKFILKI